MILACPNMPGMLQAAATSHPFSSSLLAPSPVHRCLLSSFSIVVAHRKDIVAFTHFEHASRPHSGRVQLLRPGHSDNSTCSKSSTFA